MTNSSRARVMDGAALAKRLLGATAQRAVEFRSRWGRPPCLAAVLVGDDPASVTYVKMKRARCEAAGLDALLVHLPADSTTAEVVGEIRSLSADPAVDGILLQHPVPPQVDERSAFESIVPDKDVDGVTAASFAAMSLGLPGFLSCTPAGILRLLDEYDVDLSGMHAVVIGRSPILGRPVGMLLLGRDATVTFCHSKTRDLVEVVRTADVVVAAVGRPNFVGGAWLKPGAVVVDAGYYQGGVGDVDFAEAQTVASLITPVPGGVGPMTIALLLDQTVSAAEQRVVGVAGGWLARRGLGRGAEHGYCGRVERTIVGFHCDDKGDYVAELSCGHGQHVRHQPPFQLRPWVIDAEERARRIGAVLECPLCDREPEPFAEEGGDPACWAGSVCQECGVMMDGGPHRTGCRWESSP